MTIAAPAVCESPPPGLGVPVPVEGADLALARRAVAALLDELEAFPKPGLVSPVDSGAHSDMDAALMRRSAEALEGPFARIASAGNRGGTFLEDLVPLGLEAEKRMLAATGGVNTHRGAIFTLGLLVAASATPGTTSPEALRAALVRRFGRDLRRHARKLLPTHGEHVRTVTGAGGVRAEAARGFPAIFEVGLPAYRDAVQSGMAPNPARIQTLLALMSAIEDTNILYRGGPGAAKFVRTSAANFLAGGGCRSPDWFDRALDLHRTFVRLNLSPGGCADLLAGTLFSAGCDARS